MEYAMIDGTAVRVHLHGQDAKDEGGKQAIGRSFTPIPGQHYSGDFIQERPCFSNVGPLPGCQGKSYGLARSIDNGVDFRGQSDTGPSDGLICGPF
ncbi:hypothetical protein Gain_0144_047 [Komagataeibacter intermedius TF2]|nr:hypothetical protein Gain_0144_047 [Komagataeibacter intermedius TF2]GBQ69113.1 hypothetical protein AA0521_1393 [Komagataeibacter intermedius NRIC 0521]